MNVTQEDYLNTAILAVGRLYVENMLLAQNLQQDTDTLDPTEDRRE